MRKKYNCEEHPDYSRWLAMRQRCLNPTSDNYHRYGAKGITIAEDLMSFEDFSTYISTLNNYEVVGVTLDRIDPKKNYEKGNLRWASKSVQNANQLGNSKGNNKYVGVNWSKTHMRWVARVTLEGKTLLSKVCLTQEEALQIRNRFIVENNLPHPIQEWKGE